MSRVIVIGAGSSGLSTAEWLREEHEVTVLEASEEAGGNTRTLKADGLHLDRGSNGFLDNEPAMDRLLERIGCTDDQVKARKGERYVVVGGKMTAIPSSGASFALSPILTLRAKLRMLVEPLMPRGPAEESIADFVRRRIGQQPVERMIGPMVSGIYAGDPEKLSLTACFPKMKQMETEHGSLVRAMIARRKSTSDAAAGPPGHLTSFAGGMGYLTDTLSARLGENLHTGTPCTGLVREGDIWKVQTPEGSMEADAVVLACQAFAQARLLKDLDEALSGTLAAIPYSPIAVVCLVLPASGWTPPDGFGVLVPKVEGFGILGTLFTSYIFPDHVPEDTVLLRTMIGGDGSSLEGITDDDLAATARTENARLLGTLPEPRAAHVFRYDRGIPQYRVGHPATVETIREREGALPGLFLTGNHLGGIGVKDCVRNGEQTAERVRSYLA